MMEDSENVVTRGKRGSRCATRVHDMMGIVVEGAGCMRNVARCKRSWQSCV
jgi:hypothetical protein